MNKIKKLESITISTNILRTPPRSFILSPGLVLIGLAVLILLAPKLVAFIVATVLLAVGAIVSFLAWKFIQLQKKIKQAVAEHAAKYANSSHSNTIEVPAGAKATYRIVDGALVPAVDTEMDTDSAEGEVDNQEDPLQSDGEKNRSVEEETLEAVEIVMGNSADSVFERRGRSKRIVIH